MNSVGSTYLALIGTDSKRLSLLMRGLVAAEVQVAKLFSMRPIKGQNPRLAITSCPLSNVRSRTDSSQAPLLHTLMNRTTTRTRRR